MESLQVVCATRHSATAFFAESLTGRCLEKYCGLYQINLSISPDGNPGLPPVFNRAIEQYIDEDAIFVFIHDDIAFLDFYWPETLAESLKTFDVVGLVGNRRRLPGQASWCYLDASFTWDDQGNLCGAMAHGTEFPSHIGYYGRSKEQFRHEMKLIDGVFIAIRAETLRRTGLRFDERFNFHFYDMDICRQAEQLGLKLGVAPISALHASGGAFTSPEWYKGYQTYLDKWGE